MIFDDFDSYNYSVAHNLLEFDTVDLIPLNENEMRVMRLISKILKYAMLHGWDGIGHPKEDITFNVACCLRNNGYHLSFIDEPAYNHIIHIHKR